VGKSLLTVRRWRQRYVAKGVDGLLKDATRPSRVKPLLPETIERVVHMTLHEKPPNATHWSPRSMAKAAGISYSSVQRIWHAHGLKPHLVETFKVSRDKNFAAKVTDVVGLRRRTQERHHGVSGKPQCRSQALHLDQVCR
jgi:transposase